MFNVYSLFPVNPSFRSVDAFQAEGSGGELALFELCGVNLRHGWLAGDGKEGDIMRGIETYDAAQDALVAASEAEAALAKGEATPKQLQQIENGK